MTGQKPEGRSALMDEGLIPAKPPRAQTQLAAGLVAQLQLEQESKAPLAREIPKPALPREVQPLKDY